MSVTSVELRAKPVTAEAFAAFDPEWRYDLLEGKLEPMPPMPGAAHGVFAMVIASYATLFAIDNQLGQGFAAETRFILARNPDTALGPDWAFVAKDRLPAVIPAGFLELAPDIVLEVRSPSDPPAEVGRKVERWLAFGVKIVWELNPKTRVLTIHRAGVAPRTLAADDTLTGEEILPGFALPLRRLFPAPDA